MAKVKFNTFKMTSRITAAIKTAPYDRIGRTVVKRIKTVARAGVSPVTGKRFKRLKRSTIEARKKLVELGNKTNKSFSAAKSNLTFSGQLLNALRFTKFVRPGLVELDFFVNPSSRRPYKTGKKKKKGAKKPPDNAKLAEYQADKGRRFVGLDSKGEKQVVKIVQAHIRKTLRKISK